MKIFPQNNKEQLEIPRPPRRSAKANFLTLCSILAGIYLAFSFALNAAHADPPTSPYTPGETLAPTCSPTSTNCTVDPPLFSTTTLPMGGILFMNDTSGTVTAATSSLYWNAAMPQLQIATTPSTSTQTSTLLLLGPNQLGVPSGQPSGTWFGINQSTSTGADFLNFETNSTTELQVSSSGMVTTNAIQINNDFNLGTSTNPAASILYVATTTAIFSVNLNGTTNAGGAFNASGTITQNGVAVSTSQITTSTAGIANFFPIWTSGSALGASWIQQTANSLIIATGTGTWTLNSSSTSFLQLGSSSIQKGNVSGTFFGINASSGFNGDFANFEVNSSSEFDLSATGTLILAGNLTVSSTVSSSQEYIASSTITRLTFTNATSTGNLQVATLHTTGAVTASTTLIVQGTSTLFGRVSIGTSSFTGGTSTLVVCSTGTCTASTTASTTNTVIWVGSTNNAATGTSITAKGSIASGQADVGEYIPIVGDDSDYSQGEVLTTVGTSSPLFGPSQIAYDPNLAGVVTITAGLIAGGGVDHGNTVIALAGRIPVNVTAANGDINSGDFLTSSNIPGVAMLSTQPGRVLGMALTDFAEDPNNPNATSQVMMLVNPGWNLGSLTDPADIASSSWAVIGTDSNGQPILDQFTAYVQAALAKLGLAIQNGIATLQGVVANTVNTNELCVQGVCVNGSQFGAMMNNSGSGNGSGGSPSDAPAVTSGSPATSGSDSDSASSTTSDPDSTSDPTSTPTIVPPSSPSSSVTASDDSGGASTSDDNASTSSE